jgi:hypothetical protein
VNPQRDAESDDGAQREHACGTDESGKGHV